MRCRSLPIVFAVVAFIAADALPCGDKFLTVGRGTRYQRGYVSVHPSSILILNGKYTAKPEFRKRLRMAGHRIEVSPDLDALRTKVLSGKYAVVLADLSEARDVESMLSGVKAKATLLPVIDESGSRTSADELAKYSCVIDATKSKKKHFLAVLDDVLGEVAEGKEAVCPAPDAK